MIRLFNLCLYFGYKTPSAALHWVSEASSCHYRWVGMSVRHVFIGIMWRRPKAGAPW